MKKTYRFIGMFIFNILISLDQLANVLLLGSPDETISSRLSRAIKSGNPKKSVRFFAKLVDGLFWVIQKKHIEKSLEVDEDSEGELWKWYK